MVKQHNFPNLIFSHKYDIANIFCNGRTENLTIQIYWKIKVCFYSLSKLSKKLFIGIFHKKSARNNSDLEWHSFHPDCKTDYIDIWTDILHTSYSIDYHYWKKECNNISVIMYRRKVYVVAPKWLFFIAVTITRLPITSDLIVLLSFSFPIKMPYLQIQIKYENKIRNTK